LTQDTNDDAPSRLPHSQRPSPRLVLPEARGQARGDSRPIIDIPTRARTHTPRLTGRRARHQRQHRRRHPLMPARESARTV
jgi:hypothetical protein